MPSIAFKHPSSDFTAFICVVVIMRSSFECASRDGRKWASSHWCTSQPCSDGWQQFSDDDVGMMVCVRTKEWGGMWEHLTAQSYCWNWIIDFPSHIIWSMTTLHQTGFCPTLSHQTSSSCSGIMFNNTNSIITDYKYCWNKICNWECYYKIRNCFYFSKTYWCYTCSWW